VWAAVLGSVLLLNIIIFFLHNIIILNIIIFLPLGIIIYIILLHLIILNIITLNIIVRNILILIIIIVIIHILMHYPPTPRHCLGPLAGIIRLFTRNNGDYNLGNADEPLYP
jgi:hypothetical protein